MWGESQRRPARQPWYWFTVLPKIQVRADYHELVYVHINLVFPNSTTDLTIRDNNYYTNNNHHYKYFLSEKHVTLHKLWKEKCLAIVSRTVSSYTNWN